MDLISPLEELTKWSKLYPEYVNYSNFKMSDDSHVSIQILSVIFDKYWAILSCQKYTNCKASPGTEQ